MPQNELVDLNELVINFIENYPLMKLLCPDHAKVLPKDINWKQVRIQRDNAKYEKDPNVSKPSASVVFSSTFENNTNETQVYSLKTERTTSTMCSYHLTKAYCKGSEMSIKLTAPYIEVGGGIQQEVMVEMMNEQSFTQQMIWSVDNNVTVASGHKMKAELVITESEYENTFTSDTHFSGNIIVMLTGKDKKSKPGIVDVREIFNKNTGFTVKGNVATYTCEGSCKCRYGVEQKVKLTQTKIPEDKKLENGIEDIDINDSIDS